MREKDGIRIGRGRRSPKQGEIMDGGKFAQNLSIKTNLILSKAAFSPSSARLPILMHALALWLSCPPPCLTKHPVSVSGKDAVELALWKSGTIVERTCHALEAGHLDII